MQVPSFNLLSSNIGENFVITSSCAACYSEADLVASIWEPLSCTYFIWKRMLWGLFDGYNWCILNLKSYLSLPWRTWTPRKDITQPYLISGSSSLHSSLSSLNGVTIIVYKITIPITSVYWERFYYWISEDVLIKVTRFMEFPFH